MNKRIAVLPGDGIGPEVIDAALAVLQAAGTVAGINFETEEGLAGGVAIDRTGSPLPDSTKELCLDAGAVLFGSVGGPKWDHLLMPNTPEYAIIELRQLLKCYVNLRPAKTFPSMLDSSPLKSSVLGSGVDILIVRELMEDSYYGTPKYRESTDEGLHAVDTAFYNSSTIKRVVNLACDLAARRTGKVTVVTKPNVLETSRLFRDISIEVSKQRTDITMVQEIVDATSLRLLTRPHDYDVIVTTNQFGDILGDEIGVYSGSLGLNTSVAYSDRGIHLYEPTHGSAPDIAGKGVANPIATILCLAMMFRHSFQLDDLADRVEGAIERVLQSGVGTVDISVEGRKVVSTKEFGDRVSKEVLVGG